MSDSAILIVEDDIEMAEVLLKGFEMERLQVTVASDGPEALRVAREMRFQAIVLDVMLPLLDGYAVAETLRGSGDRTPILMLTARDSVADIVRGLNCGVEDYLTKPFSFLELSARVRSLIRRGQPAVDVLRVADLRLDATAHEVTRDGEVLKLTPNEFKLLELLMKNVGHVVRRQELMDGVWAAQAVDSNSVDVAVSSLRAKVDKGRLRLIETVRGFGYRMRQPERK